MTTPAGWYDDGSGRQRWWDGQQWTDHYAPDAAASAPSPSPALSSSSEAPAYAPPAAPGALTASGYGSAPSSGGVTGYGAPGTYGAPGGYGAVADAPKPMSVLGLVGFGLAVLGTILVLFPITMIFGWVLLFAGFVVSVVSLFLRGKKWPGITGIGVSILGTIVGVIAFFVLLAMGITQTAIDVAESLPSSSPSYGTDTSSPSPEPDETTGSADRPTVDEVAVGITAVIDQTGDAGFTDEQITCFAQEFVDSDIPDDTLREIAESDGTFTDPDTAYQFGDELASATAVCLF